MRVLPTAVALCSVLALPVSVFTTGSRQAPYRSLFTAQLNGSPTPRRPTANAIQFTPPIAAPSASAPTIVCGMTVVQGDSSIDAAIVHRLPANTPTPLIAVVPPERCKH